MKLSKEQLKGRLRNVANKNNADARVLLRQFMMERFLERLSKSKYRDNFIIKGGTLVTAMMGVSLRSTMDVDTTIRGFDLNSEEAQRIVNEIMSIDLDDNASFKIKSVEDIMDEMDYSGIRLHIDSYYDRIYAPIKIDISTGDIITPGAVEYEYKQILDDETIKLWSYNLETVLAEKIQTILNRGVLNTRMRDFYDIHMLLGIYEDDIDVDVLKDAYRATAEKRQTNTILNSSQRILQDVGDSPEVLTHWERYRKKYKYAENISFEEVVESSKKLCNMIIQ
ncbi:MAG: nucleotidyl transferase AbiEii/AbiGii toxin family protein [Eubacterium sp.]|nr:nucleotidyl transferase AbiEii/AbiGii toxin family protein [Eubacterium sp.]